MNDRLVGHKGRDRLDSGEGNDVMIGGAGADEFFFGFGHDSDRIWDFKLGTDALLFSAIDFEDMSAQELVDSFGRVNRKGVVLDFGDSEVLGADYNDRLTLIGVFDLDALADDISFI
jgi:Ca2+-binding RTX toxin-like protein